MRIHVLPTSKVVEATGSRDDTYAVVGLLLTRTDRITFAAMQSRGSACWAREGVTLEPEPEPPMPQAEARIRSLVAEQEKAEFRIHGLVDAGDGVAGLLTALKAWEQAKGEPLA